MSQRALWAIAATVTSAALIAWMAIGFLTA